MNVIKAISRLKYKEREEYGTTRIEVSELRDIPENYSRYIYEYDAGKNRYIVHKIRTVRQAARVIIGKYNGSKYNVSIKDVFRKQHIHGFAMEDLINIYGECLERATNNALVCVGNKIESLDIMYSVSIQHQKCNLDNYI